VKMLTGVCALGHRSCCTYADARLPHARCELESAQEQLQAREASVDALEVQLAHALKALKEDELGEQKCLSCPGAADEAASARLDCMTTEREALITRKQALESALHKKDIEMERVRDGHSDKQVPTCL
jgi:hypothetical protein